MLYLDDDIKILLIDLYHQGKLQSISLPPVLREVWSGVDSLWAGWVTPLGGRDRQSFSPWLRHLTHDIRLLLPWAPSDTNSADAMVAMFVASIGFMHELLPG